MISAYGARAPEPKVFESWGRVIPMRSFDPSVESERID
jgi:hypothetical protein